MSAKPNWNDIEIAYIATNRPVLQIANEHGVSEGAIRARAKKHGWVRDILPIKRAQVAQRMSGITFGATNAEIRNALENDVNDSVSDMQIGLDVARAILRQIQAVVASTHDALPLKQLSEANQINVETIRRIRELDEPTKTAAPAAMAEALATMRAFYGL